MEGLEAFLDWEGTDESSEAKARRVAAELMSLVRGAKVGVLSHLINANDLLPLLEKELASEIPNKWKSPWPCKSSKRNQVPACLCFCNSSFSKS